MIDETLKQRWQKQKAKRIIESGGLGLAQMIELLQGEGGSAEGKAEAGSSGQRVYEAACRGLEGK